MWYEVAYGKGTLRFSLRPNMKATQVVSRPVPYIANAQDAVAEALAHPIGPTSFEILLTLAAGSASFLRT
jgi:hypothetical protein